MDDFDLDRHMQDILRQTRIAQQNAGEATWDPMPLAIIERTTIAVLDRLAHPLLDEKSDDGDLLEKFARHRLPNEGRSFQIVDIGDGPYFSWPGMDGFLSEGLLFKATCEAVMFHYGITTYGPEPAAVVADGDRDWVWLIKDLGSFPEEEVNDLS